MESTENRYAHLLQPIRELTKNWEIDVASELNDYLEELDEMCITFDGGRTRLNFAEAALLIQGSTCIYSKKVELLYSLVYQTLEYINDKNKKQSKEATDAQRGAAGGTQISTDAEDMAVFTPLELEASETSHKSDLHTKVDVVPLPPEALIPPENNEKNKLPLISVKGDVVCSQKDFRINLFLPGQDDLILLLLQSASASRFQLDFNLQPFQLLHPAEAAASLHADGAAGGAPDGAPEDFLPISEDMDVDQDPEEHVERLQVSAQGEGRMIRERRDVEKREETPPAAVSAWTLHDPYSTFGADKPFRAGKSYKVPEGLDDGGKRKRRRTAPLQDFRTWFRGTFDPPEPKLKVGPSFPDLNYIYLNTLKDKVKKQRRICRRVGVVMTEEELRRTFLQPEEAELQPPGAWPVDELPGGDEDGSEAEGDGGDDFCSAETQRDDLTYEELVKLRVEQLVAHSRGYTQETALSRRVKDWEDKIRPELVLQEERPPFDIHDYGERIVSELGAVGCTRTFASIVGGLDNFEACKFLLASLQLANDYTVEIDSASSGLEEHVDSMTLTLLSTHRATDRFKTLAASS